MRTQVVVSIYGESVSLTFGSLRNWWNEMEAWATELKVPPNEISGGFKQKPKGLVSHNGYELARYRSRFIKQLETENIEGLELMRVWPEGGYKTVDWDFIGLYGRDRFTDTRFVVGIDVDRLRDLPGASVQSFSQEVIRRSRRYINTQYGLAVSMPRLFMAGGYAIGLSSRELPDDMGWDANAWGRFSAKECDHTLRNVYGYNILNAKHLDIAVGGQRLEDWIKVSNDRGRLDPLPGNLYLWTFQKGDDEEAFLAWDYPPVVRVREELKKYEIFPWQKLSRQHGIDIRVKQGRRGC